MRRLVVFLISILCFACSTAPVDRFSKIKVNMSKDDVLEIVGNPNRAERYNGKDKWAYRYYTDEDSNQWDYRQVTFVEGKVVSVGVDTEELDRLKTIEADDKARDDRLKAFRLGPDPASVAPASSSTATSPAIQSSTPDARVPTESDFTEVKGTRGPVEPAETTK